MLSSPVLSGADADAARRIAVAIASRIDQDVVGCGRMLLDSSPVPSTPGALSDVGLGLSMLLRALESIGEAEPGSAAMALRHAAGLPRAPTTSLYSGFAGLLPVARYVAAGTPWFSGLRSQVARLTSSAIEDAASTTDVPPAPDEMVDVISGFAGTQIGLAGEDGCEETRATLDGLLLAFARRLTHDAPIPRSDTVLDIGFAHGLAGILSVQAARSASADARRCVEIITPIVMGTAIVLSNGGVTFPYALGPGSREPSRVAWCYGTPGISLALFHAGRALGDDAMCSTAQRAMATAADQPAGEWHLDDDALCHGRIGDALIFAHLGLMLADTRLTAVARSLAQTVIASFDPELPFGFMSMYRRPVYCHSAGFLDGSVGIALGLLTLANLAEPSWQAVLGLHLADLEGSSM